MAKDKMWVGRVSEMGGERDTCSINMLLLSDSACS